MSEPPKKKLKQEKKWKLNRHSKALFIKHAPYTTKNKEESKVDDYLKYPKISKDFLFAANSYRIYSLNFRSFQDQKYMTRICYADQEPFDYYSYEKSIPCDFEQLQQLSKWLRPDLVNFESGYIGYIEDGQRKQLEAYRKVWDELYPDAKIGLYFSDCSDKPEAMAFLTEELSPRLYNLKCNVKALIVTRAKLTLNSCIILDYEITLPDLKKFMRRGHKIKTLTFDLGKVKDPSFPYKREKNFGFNRYLKNFSTNFALKHFEIDILSYCIGEKIIEPEEIYSLLMFFPALTSFRLNIYFQTGLDPDSWLSMDETKEGILKALNCVQKLRQYLSQKVSPLLELTISYKIRAESTSSYGFQKFDGWAKKLVNHSEFVKADKIKPQDGKHYKSVQGDYYNISLSWNYKNFTGIFYYYFKAYKNSELGIDGSTDEYETEGEEKDDGEDGESELEEEEEESDKDESEEMEE